MGNYILMQRFNHDPCLHIYMYNLMYVDTETIAQEEYLPDTRSFVETEKKRLTPVLVPKQWIGFSYICSEDYELDLSIDDKKVKIKPDKFTNKRDKYICKTIIVTEDHMYI